MRRLPVFFVMDCSESMAGDPLRHMQDGLSAILKTLRTDPHALETVYISIIAFAGIARRITPLVEICNFYPPALPLGSGTNMGAALDAVMGEIDRNVVRSTPENKGDWRPIVYLITDGRPTDDAEPAINHWKAKYAAKATLIAVGIGPDADLNSLRQLTENLIQFSPNGDADFKRFIAWVSASVVAQSKSVGELSDKPVLAPFNGDFMALIGNAPVARADDSCVTLVGRCAQTRKPYLIKYVAMARNIEGLQIRLDRLQYSLAGCFPLEESFFEWSDGGVANHMVNTDQLDGTPGCPHCGAGTAFAVCGCGGLMCCNGPGEAKCPWCDKLTVFASSAAETGFNVQRSRG